MSDAPNRLLEASVRVEARLAVLNEEALHRLAVSTSIDREISRLYDEYRRAAFHAGLITADEALTICNSLNQWGFRAETPLPLRVTVAEAMAIIGRGVRP